MLKTIARMFVEQGYGNKHINVIGAAFSWAGIDIPFVPSKNSLAGRLLIAEAYALREKRRMDKEYSR